MQVCFCALSNSPEGCSCRASIKLSRPCSEEEERWPKSLTLRVKTNGPSGRSWNRAAGFPAYPPEAAKDPSAAQTAPQQARAADQGDNARGINTVEALLGLRFKPAYDAMEAAAKSMFQVSLYFCEFVISSAST